MGVLNNNNNNEDENAAKEEIDPAIKRELWVIRECEWYDDEYSDCKSIRSRFHQHFVYGKQEDCSRWKRDSANCYRWRKYRDENSVKELIDSEKKRREDRLGPFYNNNVWEHRTEPPENWNTPLPEWMEKENKNSFLAIKAAEEINMNNDPLANRQSLCVIM